MKNILNKNLDLKGKKVLLRVDLNVPMENGAITETSRIEKIIPTINLLLEKQAKIIIISHIGRPKGKVVGGMSLKPISEKLSFLLKKEVLFNKEVINENTPFEINKISNASIIMLENIRFNEGEESNDREFAKKISTLGDIYVNDAFSCSHRSHASVEGITKYIPSYFGLQITEEINALKKITSEIKKPVSEQRFPIFVGEVENNKYYIIPIRGAGLWDAIWGYIALKEDKKTIKGVIFGHKSETAGLGAEITQEWFQNRFKDEKIFDSEGELVGISVSKTNNDPKNMDKNDHEVDAISGATITGDGVTDMIIERLEHYLPYFNKLDL